MTGIFLLLHILGAAVWTGGHLVLAIGILPGVLKRGDVAFIKTFEQGFEKVGIPALVTQVFTGLYLAYGLLPDFSLWFDFSDPISRVISFKLILLFSTLALAMDARLRVIPRLCVGNLVDLAWHIVPVTVISVLFVVVGVSFKTGWFF